MQFNDLRIYDEQRQNKRREILVGLIKKEFPDANVTVINGSDYLHDPWRVRIEVSIQHPILIIEPDRPLMTDTNVSYKEIFAEGIKMAKEILSSQQFNNVAQRKIILSSKRGITIS